jgi:ribosome-associated protein
MPRHATPLYFALEGHPFVELHQLLKLTGLVDSGGAGKHLVASGEVHVDGEVELRKSCKVRAGQVVRAGDVEILVGE